jgi:hypothetical protein
MEYRVYVLVNYYLFIPNNCNGRVPRMGLRVLFALLPLEHCSTKLLKQNKTSMCQLNPKRSINRHRNCQGADFSG